MVWACSKMMKDRIILIKDAPCLIFDMVNLHTSKMADKIEGKASILAFIVDTFDQTKHGVHSLAIFQKNVGYQ